MSFSGKFRRLVSHLRIQRFKLVEGGRLQSLAIGSRTRFNMPVRCDGCGTLRIGAENVFGYAPAIRLGNGEILLQPRALESRIIIGRGNSFSNNVALVAMGEISIGDGCQIGDQVVIYDCDFHELDPGRRNSGFGPVRPVRIGNNVWLGSQVMVLKGVSIGDNTVVGAMSLVTRPLPANCIAAGNPARIIRMLDGSPAPTPSTDE